MNYGKIRKITLNNVTAYLAGVIVGDGHISKSMKSRTSNSPDYNIRIELVNKKYLNEICNLIKSIVNTNSIIRKTKKREGKQDSFYFQFRNKSFYYFLTQDLGIPAGKKCYSVTVPKSIFNSLILQKYFLAGLFDTDGGLRGHTIGFTTASNILNDEISKILTILNINYKTESWINSKNRVIYYGIRIRKKDIDTFLNQIPLRNKEKLDGIYLLCGRAGAVKRDRQF